MSTRPDQAEPLTAAQLRETAEYFANVSQRFTEFADAMEKAGKTAGIFPSVKTLRRVFTYLNGIVAGFERATFPQIQPPILTPPEDPMPLILAAEEKEEYRAKKKTPPSSPKPRKQ